MLCMLCLLLLGAGGGETWDNCRASHHSSCDGDTYYITLHIAQSPIIQLGQPSVNPPRLVLEVGGTST